ncbi:hypothetical protein, variant [Cladophialophora immunda]|uniref:Uncharacterized protein n=1 Tax=Cladophialophora immunda TaxID=569365 RepID=A0A0D2CGF3_9EURO|nr:uncharacterized protein PV07_05125 [Cladophialophora immunda]XP_016249517.1 hypothetical protein, variant [Cladophialophora immunda]KIW29300.1 hypothetical protein PV07_05125 [Cladophialophora immunda]KIW29301.1 hypothetical protein, variant [Cladophialophora immunda]
MATLAPITTPARQPFGILNESKLRSLQSVKNRQNAITPNSAPTSLKRRAVSPEVEGGSDSENIDPSILDSLHKRKRSTFDEDVSLAKTHRYSLNVTTLPTTKPRLGTTAASTPRLDTFVKPSTTPASAPAAGRSPTRKRSGLLQPRKRFNPPPFSSATQSPSLSLSAALNGTKKSRVQSRRFQKGTIETSKPKSWFFDIYEETEEAQDYRMNEWTMTQSATGLDISDDESKSLHKKSSSADRGKENIDPNEVTAPVTRSMTAAANAAAATEKAKGKEVKMNDDGARSPLADLNPAEFYAEGLDATSVVLVQDDDEEAETDVEGEETKQHHDFTFQPSMASTSLSSTAKAIEDLNAPSLAEILGSATPNLLGDAPVDKAGAPGYPFTPVHSARADADGDVEIEIWESESAKDENEKADLQLENAVDVGSPCSSVGDQNVFALQEL